MHQASRDQASRDQASRDQASTGTGTDWAAGVAGQIESVVGAVRDRSVRPLTLVAKAVVYGIIIAFMAAAVVILGAVAAVRALNIPLRDWAAELVVGGSFALAGMFLLARGRSALRKSKG